MCKLLISTPEDLEQVFKPMAVTAQALRTTCSDIWRIKIPCTLILLSVKPEDGGVQHVHQEKEGDACTFRI